MHKEPLRIITYLPNSKKDIHSKLVYSRIRHGTLILDMGNGMSMLLVSTKQRKRRTREQAITDVRRINRTTALPPAWYSKLKSYLPDCSIEWRFPTFEELEDVFKSSIHIPISNGEELKEVCIIPRRDRSRIWLYDPHYDLPLISAYHPENKNIVRPAKNGEKAYSVYVTSDILDDIKKVKQHILKTTTRF